jgi:hypothetical protein
MNRTTKIIPGAIDSIKRVSVDGISPFPSIGRANGLTTRPKSHLLEFEQFFQLHEQMNPLELLNRHPLNCKHFSF